MNPNEPRDPSDCQYNMDQDYAKFIILTNDHWIKYWMFAQICMTSQFLGV